MKNLSDNWEELRLKVLGLGDSSVRKTHYPKPIAFSSTTARLSQQ